MKKLKFKFQKRWLAAAAVPAILVIILATGGESVDVETASVQKGSITETIPVSGTIRPSVEVSVSPDVSGEVVELNVREGDTVCRGDTLLKIKQELYISMVERAEAALGSMKAEYHRQAAAARQARLNLQRCERLLKGKAASNAEYEKAKAEYDIAREQLTAASCNVRSGEASLREARGNLTKTVVISPMDGTVSKLNVTLGERVVGTSQMAGTEMLSIADMSEMEVIAEVGENDIVRIREGDKAEIVADAYSSLKFKGLISHIANSSKFIGTGLGQVANFEVSIAILPFPSGGEQDGRIPLKPGMSATVSITAADRQGILLIPVQSIVTKGRNEFVWKLTEDGTVRATGIETGIQSLDFAEVVSGLNEGDIIVCGPYQALSEELQDGSRVKVRN